MRVCTVPCGRESASLILIMLLECWLDAFKETVTELKKKIERARSRQGLQKKKGQGGARASREVCPLQTGMRAVLDEGRVGCPWRKFHCKCCTWRVLYRAAKARQKAILVLKPLLVLAAAGW